MNKLRFAVIPVLLLVMLAACNSDPYTVAAKLYDDIRLGVKSGSKTVDDLRIAGKMDSNEVRSAVGYFTTVETLNDAYSTCIRAAHTAAPYASAYRACADTLLISAQNPATLAAIHIVNPDSQAKVMLAVAGIQTTISAAEAVLAKN